VTGKLCSGAKFEDVVSSVFQFELKKEIFKFSSLREVIQADINTLNNENVNFFENANLLPSLILLLN